MRGVTPRGLVLVVTSRCDLACDHCFAQGQGQAETMDIELVARVGGQYGQLAEAAGLDQVVVCWQGGEVLTLGQSWLEEAWESFCSSFRARNRATKRVVHHLQTNLMQLDGSWIPLLRRLFGTYVSTSCDWPNVSRRRPGSAPAELDAQWLGRYQLLRKSGFQGSVIALVNHESVQRGPRQLAEHFFERLGVKDLQVNLPFPPPGRKQSMDQLQEALRSGELASFFVELQALWQDRYQERGFCLSPSYALQSFHKKTKGRRTLPCIWVPDCGRSGFSVGPTGEVGLCDAFVLAPSELSYGNIKSTPLERLLDSPRRAAQSHRWDRLKQGRCGRCPTRGSCHGGCPLRAFAWTGDPDVPDPFCAVYRAMCSQPWGQVAPGR